MDVPITTLKEPSELSCYGLSLYPPGCCNNPVQKIVYSDFKKPAVDSTLAQLDQVASGVMQNLQAVSQQMQAVLPSLMQSQMVSPPNHSGSSWGSKRRFQDDYDNDNYDRQWGGPSKRRKEGPAGNRNNWWRKAGRREPY